MKYNHYNEYYANKIDEIYLKDNFNNIEYYIEILELIYKIYYNENILVVIDKNIKYNLNSFIELFLNNPKIIYNDFDKSIKNIIDLIEVINNVTNFSNNYYINTQIKKHIEFILLNNNIINKNDCLMMSNVYNTYPDLQNKFDNYSIKQFFESYGVDFSQKILYIKDIKIPNFLLYTKNKYIDHYYEFFHLLFKIYGPLLYYGQIFQTGYEYNITDKDIVFDCGGNMGLFAAYCAGQGATVYCFEPMSYVRDFLKITQSLYPEKIYIIPYGLGDIQKEEMFGQAYNPGASNKLTFNLYNSPQVYQEKCKIIKLDDFCEKNNIIPSFIKADIEGAEMEMLKGANKILSNNKPILNICLNHRPTDPYDIINLINSINNKYQYYIFYEGDIQSKFVLCK